MSIQNAPTNDVVGPTVLWHLEIYYTPYSFVSKEQLIEFLFAITKEKIDRNVEKRKPFEDTPSTNLQENFTLEFFRGVSYNGGGFMECNRRGEHTLAGLTAFVDSLTQGLTWHGISTYKLAKGIIKEHHRLSEWEAVTHRFTISLSVLCPKQNMSSYS